MHRLVLYLLLLLATNLLHFLTCMSLCISGFYMYSRVLLMISSFRCILGFYWWLYIRVILMIVYHVYQGYIDDYISWWDHLYLYMGLIDYISCISGLYWWLFIMYIRVLFMIRPFICISRLYCWLDHLYAYQGSIDD